MSRTFPCMTPFPAALAHGCTLLILCSCQQPPAFLHNSDCLQCSQASLMLVLTIEGLACDGAAACDGLHPPLLLTLAHTQALHRL